MRRLSFVLLLFVSLSLIGTQIATATTYGLANFIVNDNGNISYGGTPITDANLNLTGYDQTVEPGDNTLGSIVITLNKSASPQAVAFYADYDVDYQSAVGGGSFNDIGSTHGTVAVGGAPGSVLTYALTDSSATIDTDAAYNDVQNVPFTGFTDVNDDGTAAGGKSPNAFDVDWGLGITGLLAPTGGTVTFTVSNTAPTSGFYIQQMNDQTGDSLYVSVSALLGPTPPPSKVPEPAYLWVAAFCLPLFALWRRSRKAA